MSKVFYIDRLGAQDTSDTYDEILTKDILKDICYRLTGVKNFKIKWNESRNYGRLISLIDEERNIKHYVFISKYGREANFRNSYFQSIPTAIGEVLNQSKSNNFDLWYYFMPNYEGNIFTDYHKFFYRILFTIGISFVNYDSVSSTNDLVEFNSLNDIINERNRLRIRNTGNNSSFIEEDDDAYNIYGKTFGANSKETVLLCMALMYIAKKPIRLYQIIDNYSDSISTNDINSMKNFALKEGVDEIEIIKDSYEFDDIFKENNLRNPRFKYNLFAKTNGDKKCAICDCHIDKIIQGAHIYPVSVIKNNSKLSDEEKMKYATDGDNGLWLCENHHKLFDSNIIKFNNGVVKYNISKLKNDKDIIYLDEITKIKNIPIELYNKGMEKYFKLRYAK